MIDFYKKQKAEWYTPVAMTLTELSTALVSNDRNRIEAKLKDACKRYAPHLAWDTRKEEFNHAVDQFMHASNTVDMLSSITGMLFVAMNAEEFNLSQYCAITDALGNMLKTLSCFDFPTNMR